MQLLFQLNQYSFYQATSARVFHIHFGNKLVAFSFCQLLALRHKINEIVIEDHFDGELNPHGFEILTLCNKEHLFILNTLEILDLKTVVNQAFDLLENPKLTLELFV
ncbi:MAG: hypothetical protein V3U92_07295 [Cellulophaga sp.]